MDFKKPLFAACICAGIYSQVIHCHKPYCPLYKLDDLPSKNTQIPINNSGYQTTVTSGTSLSTVAPYNILKGSV